jgi:hypothetical protein
MKTGCEKAKRAGLIFIEKTNHDIKNNVKVKMRTTFETRPNGPACKKRGVVEEAFLFATAKTIGLHG